MEERLLTSKSPARNALLRTPQRPQASNEDWGNGLSGLEAVHRYLVYDT